MAPARVLSRSMNFPNQWLGVEVRHLVALEMVLSERSFAGAARKLGYTQSAVSVQIALLERIAGTQLVVRPGGRRLVSATAAGERLRGHARRLIDQIQAAESDLTALAIGEAGVVRIAAFQTASMRLLPPALARLSANSPQHRGATRRGALPSAARSPLLRGDRPGVRAAPRDGAVRVRRAHPRSVSVCHSA